MSHYLPEPLAKLNGYEVFGSICSVFRFKGVSFDSPPEIWVKEMDQGLDNTTKKKALEYVLKEHRKVLEEKQKLVEKFSKYIEDNFSKEDTSNDVVLKCLGCLYDEPNQMAHIGPGGCLGEDDDEEDYF